MCIQIYVKYDFHAVNTYYLVVVQSSRAADLSGRLEFQALRVRFQLVTEREDNEINKIKKSCFQNVFN